MATKATKSDTIGLTDKEFRAISKALSDPRRYDILRKIAAVRECTCVELRETFPISPATL